MEPVFRNAHWFGRSLRWAFTATLLFSLGSNRALAYASLVTANASATTRQQTSFTSPNQDVKSASNQAMASGDPGSAHSAGSCNGSLTTGTLTAVSHACSQLSLAEPAYITGDVGGGGQMVTDGYFTLFSPTLADGTPVTIHFNVQMQANVQVVWSSPTDFSQGGIASVSGEFRLINGPINVSGYKDIREDGLNGSSQTMAGLADGTRLTLSYSGVVGEVVEVRAALSADTRDSAINGQTTDAEARGALVWGWDSPSDVQLKSRDGYVAPPSSNVTSNYLHSVTPEPIFPGPTPTLTIAPAGTNYLLAWSSASAGFNLYQNTNLISANWLRVTNPASVVGTNMQVLVLGKNQGAAFYRLKFP
jgi:hypothetical protein